MAQKTIAEKLEELETLQSSNHSVGKQDIFKVKSGTKDIHKQYIGRTPQRIKKIARNYPEFGGSTSRKLQQLNANSGFSGNISKMGFLPNHDTKPTMNPLVTRVIGMEEAGGKGTQYAEGYIQRKEEISQAKKAFFRDDK